MTAYFDDVDTKIRELRSHLRTSGNYFEFTEGLNKIEEKVVFDCTLASSTSPFPSDLRLAIHRACLRHGVCTLPNCAVPADFETEDDHARRISMLASDLHDIFHALAHRDIPGHTDSPLSCVQSEWIYPREIERELLAHTEFGGEHPDEYVKRILGQTE